MEGRALLADDNILNTYRQVQEANAAADALQTQANMRRRIFSAQQNEQLYQFFIEDIAAAIAELRANNCPYADQAEHFLNQIKNTHDSKLQRYDSTQVSPSQLNDLLDTTRKLLRTPMLSEGNTINPDFTEHSFNFAQKMAALQLDSKAQKKNGLFNAGLALICVIGIAVVVTLGVVLNTFPVAGQIAFGLLVGVLNGIQAAYYTKNAVGFFNRAHHASQTSSKGYELVNAINQEQDRTLGLQAN